MKRQRRPKPKFYHYVHFNSSFLDRASYDPNAEVLEIDIRNNDGEVHTYRYYGVSAWDFFNLLAAKSAGEAFNDFNDNTGALARRYDPNRGTWVNA